MLSKKLLGLKSKKQGSLAEKLFSDMCEIQGIVYHRIEDGGFMSRGHLIRKKQLCDFIIFTNTRALGSYEPLFIDVKSSKNIVPSMFFGDKSRSTVRQANNFLEIYRKTGWDRSGFIFLDTDLQVIDLKNHPFKFLSVYKLNGWRNSDKNPRTFKKNYLKDYTSIRGIL